MDSPLKQASNIIPDDFKQQFNFGEIIGQGNNVVYEVTEKTTGSVYAAKVVEMDNFDEIDLNSLQLLKNCKHIVTLENYYCSTSTETKKGLVVLVLQRMTGSLDRYNLDCRKLNSEQKMKQSLSVSDIIQILKPIVLGLIEMRKHQLHHRDIKPGNILINYNKETLEILDAKLADFDISKQTENIEDMHTAIGTLQYMSPLVRQSYMVSTVKEQDKDTGKIIEKHVHSNVKHNLEKSDVYSLGTTMLVTTIVFDKKQLSKYNAKAGQTQVFQCIDKIEYAPIKELYKNMLMHDENKRFGFDQLLQAIEEIEQKVDLDAFITVVRQQKDYWQNHNFDVDILFILDITGSMDKWKNESVQAMKQATEYIKEHYLNSSFKFALVGYRDFNDKIPFEILDFTSKLEDFQAQINSIQCTGGDDICEDIAGAFSQALELQWSSQCRYAILITDSPNHGKQYYDRTLFNCSDFQLDRFPDEKTNKNDIEEVFRKLVEEQEVEVCMIKASDKLEKMVNILGDIYQKVRVVDEFQHDLLGNTQLFSYFLGTTMLNSITKKASELKKKETEQSLHKSMAEKELLFQVRTEHTILLREYEQKKTDDIKEMFKKVDAVKLEKFPKDGKFTLLRDKLKAHNLADIDFIFPQTNELLTLTENQINTKNVIEVYQKVRNIRDEVIVIFKRQIVEVYFHKYLENLQSTDITSLFHPQEDFKMTFSSQDNLFQAYSAVKQHLKAKIQFIKLQCGKKQSFSEDDMDDLLIIDVTSHVQLGQKLVILYEIKPK